MIATHPNAYLYKVLEMTTESHRVLSELKTSELLTPQLVLATLEERKLAASTQRWGGAKEMREVTDKITSLRRK